MRELEEVNCEIRKEIDLQQSISNRLKSHTTEDDRVSVHSVDNNNIFIPHGGFLNNAQYAWLSYGKNLIIVNAKTGENISSWTFCENISCVTQFPSLPGQLPLLLVGLDNDAHRVKDSQGLICVFDCALSRVLRAISMPAGVEQVCVVSGGTEWEDYNDRRADSVLNNAGGIAYVALRNLLHIVIDLQRPLWDGVDLCFVHDETTPAELDLISISHVFQKEQFSTDKHAIFNLMDKSIEDHIGFNRQEFEVSILFEKNFSTVITSSVKIGCLISGCLGRIIIWQNDGSIGWIISPIEENMVVTHIELLEPTDDPRPFYYLWVVYEDKSSNTAPILRMFALLFERKYCDKGTNLYFNLTAEPRLKFEFELEEGDKITNLSTIERGNNVDQTDSVNKRGEDNLLLISTNNRTLLFDLNQWYKEQMPRTIGERQNPNSILAHYSARSSISQKNENLVISCSYVPNTLREFANNNPLTTEELFYPNSLSLEWVELSVSHLTFWMTRGIQSEILREIAVSGPVALIEPTELFHKCMSVGLTPFNTEYSFESDLNAQREMLLSLCLEQRWTMFLIRCSKEWSDGSAAYLYPLFLKWGVQRAAAIKAIGDKLCIPLFDQSGNSIGESEIKTLRFCSQQLDCLSNVVAKLPTETADLRQQQRALKRISTYLQVVLWFYDVGLLPETQEIIDGSVPISITLKIPYPFEKLAALYKDKREQGKNDSYSLNAKQEVFFIDELITRECSTLKLQWERESNDEEDLKGYYPPPSLQSLLRSHLADCYQEDLDEILSKHQITIYLLMDLAMLLQGSYPSVDQLIKYPSAFKINPSVIKLTQAFWLLDHEDYQGFIDIMTGQLVFDSDVKDWHHQFIVRTLIRNKQHKLALIYLRVRKPPLSSISDQGTVINLSVEHGLVQSAFHRRPPSHYTQLLTCFFKACKSYGKISDILHLSLESEEEEVFVKFLEEENLEDVRLLYYLQRSRYTEAGNGKSLNVLKNSGLKTVQQISLYMLSAYNATLPEIIKQFSTNFNPNTMDIDEESRYPKPMSHYKSVAPPSLNFEMAIKKAKETFFKEDRSQIPFVSAPCSSLRGNSDNSNVNRIIYPSIVKRCAKRSLDQMREDDDDEDNKSFDTSKRRKLVDNSNMANNLCVKTLGLSAAETPVVKRKIHSPSQKDEPLETTQSILKIRQMIRNSASPTFSEPMTDHSISSQTSEKQKKLIRQIRFNFNQSDEVDNMEIENAKDDSKDSDVYFSPNISGVHDSAVLSDNSNYEGTDVYCPRPRPSLRRSADKSLKSNESSTSFTKTGSSSESSTLVSSGNSSQLQPEMNKSQFNKSIGQSLLQASSYSTTVLSSDTSYEVSMTNQNLATRILHRSSKLSTESSTPLDSPITFSTYKHAVSSTPLVKTKLQVELESQSDEQCQMDVDEDDTHENKSHLEHSKKLLNVPILSYNDSSQKTVSVQDEDTKSENSSDSEEQFVRRLVPSAGDSSELLVRTSTLEKDANKRETGDVDNSDEEVIRLEYHADDDNDDLKNLHESTEFVQTAMKDEENKSDSTSDKERKQPQVIEFFDITDDESNDEAEKATPNSQKNTKNISNEKEKLKTVGDENITDDESDNDNVFVSSKNTSPVAQTEEYSDSDSDESMSSACSLKLVKSQETKTASENVPRDIKSTVEDKSSSSPKSTAKKTSTRAPRTRKGIRSTSITEPAEEEQVPVRRTTRAASVTKESASDSLTTKTQSKVSPKTEKKGRTRRRNLSVTDVSAESESIAESVDESSVADSLTSKVTANKRTRSKRSASVDKDLSDTNDQSKSNEGVTLRRSTRRAASVQKELPTTIQSLRNRTVSIAEETEENEEDKESNKKKPAVRGRKAVASTSNLKETDTTKVGKEATVSVDNKIRRKRGVSEPKEILLRNVRSRRSSSVLSDVILEESNESMMSETSQKSNLLTRNTSNQINSPASNTRSRRSSMQSIPDELEPSVTNDEKMSNANTSKITQRTRKTRRAVSVDAPQVDVKKRVRNLRSKNLIQDAIEEEISDSQAITSAEPVNTMKATKGRKKTASVTDLKSVKDLVEITKKGRKASSSSKNDEFMFSQPGVSSDSPANQSDVGQVPKFIFSPPHTRSRDDSSDQRQK